jgi:predicted transcriptional regulator
LVNNTSKISGGDSDFALAVANLAAAAIAANPKLAMAEAVADAADSLRRASAAPLLIKDSIRPDRIRCLEDGTWHIMLRRYLRRKFNLTPQQYRKKWGLPDDYPLIAPDYSRARSKIARKTGLGRK